ncbi:MAG TPA: pyrimidine dimer DNA glycosylase/endonuclease V [Woeseiaceae bacterium]|nr:pyrimidine dimer DNA glycosylase/endonuclease V [Woeseiaceae bacterium]
MTRINLVDPVELSNQHLIAEYREIFMVGSALQRSIKSKNWENVKSNLPSKFTLNTGHVKFFYNKGKYLHKRYKLLVKEMKRREMRPDPDRKFRKSQFPRDFYKDWSPDPKDLEVIRRRILEKINQKPDWYKWYE